MRAGFFDRLATAIKADAHGALDALEERGLLLKQCLREAELEVGRKRALAAGLEAEERRLAEARARLLRECASLDEDVALALGGGKEDLARFAARRLLAGRRELEAVAQRAERTAAERGRLAEKLAAQERDLETLRRDVRAKLAQLESEPGPAAPAAASSACVSDEEVELELLRRRTGEGR
jgi:phage shock protein A